MKKCMIAYCRGWSAFIMMLAAVESSGAATITWTNSMGGNWSKADNWSPNQTPGADDTAVIADEAEGSSFTVNLDVNVNITGLQLGGRGNCAGRQRLSLNSKTLTLAGPLAVGQCGQFSLDSGMLTGTGNAVISGVVTWTGGTLNGTLTVATNGAVVLAGVAGQTYELYGALTNLGTVTLAGGDLDFQGNILGRLINLAGGLVDIQTDLTVYSYNNQGAFYNWGTVRKSGGTGTTTIRPRFYNYGKLDSQSGMLAFTGGGSLNDGSSFGGAAGVQLADGVFTISGVVEGSNAILGGASLAGTNGVFAGEWSWTNGNVAAGATLTVGTNSVLSISGPGGQELVLFGILTNAGTISLKSGVLICQGNLQGFLVNLPGGLVDITDDLVIRNYNNRGAFINWGTLRKSGGTGTSTLWPAFYSHGTVEVQSGTLSYLGPQLVFEDGSRLIGPGTNLLAGATVTLEGAVEAQNLVLGVGIINGNCVLSGTASWTAGRLEDGAILTVETNGILGLVGPEQKVIVGLLRNRGRILFSGGGRMAMGSLSTMAAVDNQVGAIFEISSDAPIAWTGYSQPSFTNAGIFRKTSTPGTTLLDGILFRNSGTVDVQSGAVAYVATGSSFEDGSRLQGLGTNLLAAGNISLRGAIYAENLELGGAVILGSNILSGKVYWTKGLIEDGTSMTIAHNGIFVISGPELKANCGVINNEGAIFVYGTGTLGLGTKSGPAVINNRHGALFDLVEDTPIRWTGFSIPSITNAGTFRKSGGTSVNLIDGIPFGNSGTVAAQTGAIAFNATGSVFGEGTQFTGRGTNLLAGGTIQMSGAIYSENLVIAGAEIVGTGQLSGNAIWTSGILLPQANLSVATNGTLRITGSELKAIVGVLNNDGIIQLSGMGTLGMGSQLSLAVLNNRAGATFEAQSDARIAWTGFALPVFTNGGTFRKNGGTNTTLFDGVPFFNSGTVDVQTGAVGYNATGTAFESGSRLVGPGTNLLLGGEIALDGTIFSENLQIAGATVVGNSLLSGVASWTAGLIPTKGTLTIATNGTLRIAGSEQKVLLGVLNNRGTIRLSGTGTVAMGSQTAIANINNEAGGVFEATSGASIAWTGLAQPLFSNVGTFRKTDASTNTITVPFMNFGTVDVQSGVLVLGGSYTLVGGKLNFGISGPTNCGRIYFAAAAALAGGLSANLSGGYKPRRGDSFPLLGYPSKSGMFEYAQLPDCASWQTNYDANAFNLQVLNARPSIADVPLQGVDELKTLNVTNSATHADADLQTLRFALVFAPAGMAIDTNSGVVTWTPAQTQSPSTNVVWVSVTDNGTPALSSTNSFVVVVREVNMAPVLSLVQTQSVEELTVLRVTNSAIEPNIHSVTVGYALLTAPAGAAIDQNGIISWGPSQQQSPSTNLFVTIVTNANAYDLINPNLIATNAFMVVVKEVNMAPVLRLIPTQTTYEQTLLMVTNAATEPNIHSTSEYRLDNPPAGMSIGSDGVITWIPDPAQAPSTNLITTVVTNANPYDSIHPSLGATNQFFVIVYQRPKLTPARQTAGGFQFTFLTIPGETYTLQFSTDLRAWISKSSFEGYGGPLTIKDPDWATRPAGFYRVQLGR